MIIKRKHFFILVVTLGWVFIHQSCTHDPFMINDIDPNPMDTTTNPMDTMTIDTTLVGTPCDPAVIYFEKDILPILLGNCAIAGCHNSAAANDGVILDSYENVIKTAKVKPFDLSDSKLYKVITENDPDKIMPPTGKMDNNKISLISQWLLQGAKNLDCDEVSNCVTENTTYSGYVKGVFSTSCNGCHNTSSSFGGVILDTYAGVKSVVNTGRLYGAINWSQGFQRMPQGQSQLDSCKIAKVKKWLDEGAQNN